MADGFIVANDRILENGYRFLSESKFWEADSEFDKVLQRDTKCSRAYRGKMLARNTWTDEAAAEHPDAVARICADMIARVELFQLTDARIAAEVLSILMPEFDAAMQYAIELDKQGLRLFFERLHASALAYIQTRQEEAQAQRLRIEQLIRAERYIQEQEEQESKRLHRKNSRFESVSVIFVFSAILGAIALIVGCFVSPGTPLWTVVAGVTGLGWGYTIIVIGRSSIGAAIFWGGIVGLLVLLLIVSYSCSIAGQITAFISVAIGIVIGILRR